MAGAYHVRCQGCDYEDTVSGGTDYAYRLAEWPDVFLWVQFAWCQNCSRVVQAEDLLPPKASEEWMAGHTNRRALKDARRYREMIDARRPPPRCLSCGSVDILPASGHTGERWEWIVPHPPCNGEILIAGKIYTSGIPATAVYTPEGEFLERVDGLLLPGRGY